MAFGNLITKVLNMKKRGFKIQKKFPAHAQALHDNKNVY